MENIGARFIWNTRYFHVAKQGEKLSSFAISGGHAQGLVEYCGTRETVALNIESNNKDLPSTDKQKELINNLYRMVPDYKYFLEYEDYKKAPTQQNASELITTLSEQVILHGAFNEASNLVEYTAKRPGVVQVGTHGLFSSDDNVDLKKAQEEISNHKGNIWTHVLSLRREDADKLGYDNQERWKSLIKSNLNVLAEAHNIDLKNLQWYAAMHNTGHHPHVHLFVFSKNPNEGFFSQKGKNNSLKMCKQEFSKIIFSADRETAYEQKHKYREELKNTTKAILNKINENPLDGYSENAKNSIIKNLTILSQSVDADKDLKYGYQTKEIKSLVDDIQRQLIYDNEHLSNLYMKWCEQQFNIERIYVTKPQEVPIEQNKEFAPMKKYILDTAQRMAKQLNDIKITNHEDILSEDNSEDIKLTTDNYTSVYPEHLSKTDDEMISEFDYLKLFASDIRNRDGDICCKLADCYRYGNGTEKDITSAMMWYGISADQYKNPIAMYRLGEIYENSQGDIEDLNLSNEYYQDAYYTIKNNIKNFEFFNNLAEGNTPEEFYSNVTTDDAYKEFLIGCMYYDGKGVKQSYDKALDSFLVASANGNKNATYRVGEMLLKGLGTEQNIESGIRYLQKSTESGNPYASFLLYQYYKNITNNENLAEINLQFSAINGHPIAQTIVAKQLIREGAIETAVNYLVSATKKGINEAHYFLGQVYNDKTNIDYYDSAKAQDHFKLALEYYLNEYDKNNNKHLAYNIGKMFFNGEGTSRDVDMARKWFKRANEEASNQQHQKEIEATEEATNISLHSVASMATHFGKIIQNNTMSTANHRYMPDQKLAKEIKKQKINAGHSSDDTADYNFDY